MVKKLLNFGKWGAIILAGIFIILSILPWLIPIPVVTEAPVPPDLQTLDCNGQTIRFRVINPEGVPNSGRPVFMLLHGFCGSSWNWRSFQDSLANHGYPSVAMDIPPFGYSRTHDHSQYTDSARIMAIRQVMNHTFPKCSWIVAGHSMGAVLAGQTALASDDVLGVLCIDGVPFTPVRRSVFSRTLTYPPLIRWAKVVGFHRLLTENGIRGLLQSAYGQEPDSAQVRAYLLPMRRPDFPAELFEWASAQGKPMDAWKENTFPMLMIWGKSDAWIPVSVAEQFREKYPETDLHLVPGAGHCPMETHLSEVSPIVVHWADSVFFVY